VTEVINEKKGDNDSYECIYDLVTVDGFIEELVNFSVTKIYLRLIFPILKTFGKLKINCTLTAELKLFFNTSK
jgi:hypothetical protein